MQLSLFQLWCKDSLQSHSASFYIHKYFVYFIWNNFYQKVLLKKKFYLFFYKIFLSSKNIINYTFQIYLQSNKLICMFLFIDRWQYLLQIHIKLFQHFENIYFIASCNIFYPSSVVSLLIHWVCSVHVPEVARRWA